jgi:hypothetical protein
MAPGSPPSRWLADPPPADGRKVIITDNDHYSPMSADALWAWKSFLRGHHPILMDMGLIGGVAPSDPSAGGPMSYEAFEPARWAMGDTRRFAERMDLVETEPRGDLASTGYALAAPGREYLVLHPDGGSFTVTLEPGTYSAEWFDVESRETTSSEPTVVGPSGSVSFDPPSPTAGASVLYLKRM